MSSSSTSSNEEEEEEEEEETSTSCDDSAGIQRISHMGGRGTLWKTPFRLEFCQDAMDEIDSSFFDHIDDLLDFPTEDIDSILPSSLGKPETLLPNIWAESYPCSDSVFSGGAANSSDLSAELSVPYEDIVQLEWLSKFMEDSFSGGSLAMTTAAEPEPVPKNHRLFHTSSPVSVLDSSSSSSSSCSGEKTALHSPDAVVLGGKYGRARSKRPRPATFSPRRTMVQLVPPPPLLHYSISEDESPSLVPLKFHHEPSENFAESYPTVKAPEESAVTEPKKKKKKIKLTLPLRPGLADAEDEDGGSTLAPVRKCLHCEITKTPQWRAGPLGPKTLCNACGVRYKSGRLFPEYRPAASPTYIPSLHSNSHKKVLEMRGITAEKPATNGGAAVKEAEELIPNPDVARRND
ncbi:hypothetical protein MLD38_018987 [Melastoma candidum]|uniref:Uncharacterized protein n=1 Tax=Melastoma candidum TaxID=119954 RepID=A0ACB9QVH3_9MYRT|nr:hypothetical protein MLD38_018987 [Melastoma candidum]